MDAGAVHALLDSDLFKTAPHSLGTAERVQLSIAKAREIATAYRLTLDDIAHLSRRFWEFHADPIVTDDGAAMTLLTIQLNLVIGTILDTVGERSDLVPLLNDLLEYKVSGQFCLTEVDHGLDAANIETTATALPNDGGYIIHTPHLGASKYMPPTVPCGIPCVGIIMARLIKDGVDLGINPFLVPLNDGEVMCPGIVARALPPRGGSAPVRHSITTFSNVVVTRSSLLQRESDAPSHPLSDDSKRLRYLKVIWRVGIGSLCLSATVIPVLVRSAYIVALYSKRRHISVGAPHPKSVPIIHLSTQHAPILTAFAQSFVLTEFYKAAAKIFSDERVDFRVRHGIATCFKVVALRHMQEGNSLADRCGAQGLFAYNGISELHADMRGIAIAEGDVLALSIRLATELLLNRYTLSMGLGSTSSNPLALHSQGLLSSTRSALQELGDHRTDDANRRVLPRCKPIVEALGMRFAYEAALAAGVEDSITRLYLATAMRADEAWYVENLRLGQDQLFRAEEDAVRVALPRLETWVARSGVGKYAAAPIVSAERWAEFVSQLEVFQFQGGKGVSLTRSHL